MSIVGPRVFVAAVALSAAAYLGACDDSTAPLGPGSFDATLAFSPDSAVSGQAIFVGGTESGVTANLTSTDGFTIRVSRGAFGNIGPYAVGTQLGRFTGFIRVPVNGTLVEYTLVDGTINVTSVDARHFLAELTATASTTAEGVERTTFTFTADIRANCQNTCLF